MSKHYRCFGCSECRLDDLAGEFPYLCPQCVEKLWNIHVKDIENLQLSSVQRFIGSEVILLEIEALKDALTKIIDLEKPCPDNDPLGMGIVNESYRIAKKALQNKCLTSSQ